MAESKEKNSLDGTPLDWIDEAFLSEQGDEVPFDEMEPVGVAHESVDCSEVTSDSLPDSWICESDSSDEAGLLVTDNFGDEEQDDNAEYVDPFSVVDRPSESLLRPTLLEASAGTGKTFSIKHLVLRLIVEHNKAIDKILVVTFTRAATSELSTRIREHLADTVRYVEVCRRLSEKAERNEDDPEMAETTRCRLIARDPLAYARSIGEKSTAALEAILKETDALIVQQVQNWIEMQTVSEAGDDRAVPLDFDIQLMRLRRALSNFDNAAIYTIHSFCKQMLDRHAFSASGALEWELVPDDAKYRRRVIGDFLRSELNQHMDDVDRRRDLVEKVDWDCILRETVKVPEALARRRLTEPDTLLKERQRFIAEVPRALEKLKNDAGIAVYDDLLTQMWRTIRDELDHSNRGHAFLSSVRASYQAVLIDEFQDTDPVQYEVFKALFLPDNPKEWENGTLFFVGDPKQAIYSFRSADLNTYFRAKRDLKRRRARQRAVIANLPTNYRSSPALVRAVNALFTYPESKPSKNAFLNENLAFKPVQSKASNTGVFLWKNGQWQEMAPFSVRWGDTFETPAEGIEAEIEAVCADMIALIRGGQTGRVALRAESGREGNGIPTDRPPFVTLALPDGQREIALRALEPGDIAILARSVKNNAEIADLRHQLDQHGIRTRLFDDSHICNTPEAEELLTVLLAYASPDNERAVRAARATRLMGETLQDLQSDDDRRRTDIRLLLEEGRRQWTRRGVAPVLGELMTRCRTAERLLPSKGGEQSLTNFAHLIEILHEVGKRYNAPAGLIAWFESAIRNPPGSGDDRWQVRLASDANLVTIWTIHKSKGLQYPVVYLPFVKGLREKPNHSPVRRVHDENGFMELEIGTSSQTALSTQSSERVSLEGVEENIRLAYVALTRAACRIMMTVSYPKIFKGKTARPEECAYWQLLMGIAQKDFPSEHSAEIVKTRLEELNGKSLISLAELGEHYDLDGGLLVGPLPVVEASAETVQPRAGEAKRVDIAWRHSSFTGITRMISDDGDTQPVFGSRYRPDLLRRSPDMLDFPRGTQAGDALHRILEEADFQKLAGRDRETERVNLAAKTIRTYMAAFESEKEAENAAKVAGQMIYDVLNTELVPSVRLCEIGANARVSEMEFLLSMPEGLTARHLGEWLAKTNPDYAVPGLDDKTLNGFLTGFIDLAFMDKTNRFWVLDWKSNAIADQVKESTDYTQDVMSAEMSKHHYRLQYLIYLVALRRFLKHRLGEAFEDKVIGGAIYVFLRGVKVTNPRQADGSPTGVTVDRVDPAVLSDLDTLFSDNWRTLFEDGLC